MAGIVALSLAMLIIAFPHKAEIAYGKRAQAGVFFHFAFRN